MFFDTPRYNEMHDNIITKPMAMKGYKMMSVENGDVSPKGSISESSDVKDDIKKIKAYNAQKKAKVAKNNKIVEIDCLNVETPIKKVPRPRNAFILVRQH